MSISWPNGARIAVSLVVNVEEGSERSVARGDSGMEAVDEFGMFIKGPVRNYANETNYQFGIKEGAPRILRHTCDTLVAVEATLGYSCPVGKLA